MRGTVIRLCCRQSRSGSSAAVGAEHTDVDGVEATDRGRHVIDLHDRLVRGDAVPAEWPHPRRRGAACRPQPAPAGPPPGCRPARQRPGRPPAAGLREETGGSRPGPAPATSPAPARHRRLRQHDQYAFHTSIIGTDPRASARRSATVRCCWTRTSSSSTDPCGPSSDATPTSRPPGCHGERITVLGNRPGLDSGDPRCRARPAPVRVQQGGLGAPFGPRRQAGLIATGKRSRRLAARDGCHAAGSSAGSGGDQAAARQRRHGEVVLVVGPFLFVDRFAVDRSADRFG